MATLSFPNAKLYGKKTLLVDQTEARERACLEAFERELDMPWALYRVRRLFLLSGDGGHRSPYCRKAAKDPQAARPGPCSGCADTLDSHKVPTAAAVAGLTLRRGCCTRTERDDGTIR
ncbi:hypothetical protein ACFXDI_09950 [Streptomyces mirabilis]|uniref:hypothetical protein n=1 Tax=Streptomyces mirabilis TaxID=68239 RepID=UPI0036A65CC2